MSWTSQQDRKREEHKVSRDGFPQGRGIPSSTPCHLDELQKRAHRGRPLPLPLPLPLRSTPYVLKPGGLREQSAHTSIHYQSSCIRRQTQAHATLRDRSALENPACEPQVPPISAQQSSGVSIPKFVCKAFHPCINLKSLALSSAHCFTDLAS